MPTCTYLLSGPFDITSLSTLGYLDPGTGSYALQLLLAGAFGGLFALKQSWGQVRAWFAPFVSGRRSPSAPVEGTK